ARMGRSAVGQERGFCGRRALRQWQARAARDSGAGFVLRVQRRPHKSLLVISAAVVWRGASRGFEEKHYGPDWRVTGMGLARLRRQLEGRHRWPADRIGQWRHALGRRTVDQLRG